MDLVRTFCRICEPTCGLVAQVDDGVLVKLTPDRDHPVTRASRATRASPPSTSTTTPTAWTTRSCVPPTDRGARSRGTRRWPTRRPGCRRSRPSTARTRSAPTSATRPAFNALGSLHIGALLRALGVRRTFSSGTQDCANKFVASEAVFGSSTVHPIPDLEHTDLCLIIGENPRASQASFYSIPNVLGELRRATARGARIVFVNPRRIETPEHGIGDTVLIRPDTDVWFLAALLHEIDALGGFDAGVHRPARQPRRRAPRRSSRRTPPTRPRRHRHRRRRHPRAGRRRGWPRRGRRSTRRPGSTWAARARSPTGSCTCCRSSPASLDVEGGNLKSDGFYANARSGAGVPEQGYVDTEFGRLRRGALPGTLMADAILDSDEPMRAMIVVAGNPLLSIAGEERLRKAFEQLELLVVIDIYPSATAELADVVLPCGRHVRARRPQRRQHRHQRPTVRAVHAGGGGAGCRPPAGVVDRPPPAAGARPAVAPRRRRRRTRGRSGGTCSQRGSGVDLDELRATGERPRAAGAGARRVLRAPGVHRRRPGRLLPDAVRRRDRPLPHVVRARCRANAITLRLIHRRDPWMHNSWFANVPRMKRRGRTTNPLAHAPRRCRPALGHGRRRRGAGHQRPRRRSRRPSRSTTT